MLVTDREKEKEQCVLRDKTEIDGSCESLFGLIGETLFNSGGPQYFGGLCYCK